MSDHPERRWARAVRRWVRGEITMNVWVGGALIRNITYVETVRAVVYGGRP